MSAITNEAAREARARRAARQLNWVLHKSRIREAFHSDNEGGWQIVDGWSNYVLWGEKFDLALEDIEQIVAAHAEG